MTSGDKFPVVNIRTIPEHVMDYKAPKNIYRMVQDSRTTPNQISLSTKSDHIVRLVNMTQLQLRNIPYFCAILRCFHVIECGGASVAADIIG